MAMINRWLPAAASSHAQLFDRVLLGVHVHMLLIFVLWLAVFVYALVKFRKRANPEPRQHGVRWWWPAIAIGGVIVGNAIVLGALALPAWATRNAPPFDFAQDKPFDAAQGTAAGVPPVQVRITAEQFAWNIHYPGPDGVFGRTASTLISASNPAGIDRDDPAARDDIGLLNVLTLPIDRTVVIQLASRDVIHSFTLNEMRVKQDANPGITARVWFTPTQLGNWEIACSQLCGLGHYRMRGEYRIVSPEAWEAWQKEELGRLSR